MASFGEFINEITGKTAQMELANELQRQLRSTAFQDTVADMKAAGLNPAMVYASGGSASSTPSAPGASSANLAQFNILGDLAQAMNSITNARALDERTHANEISAQNASNLYKETADIARMLHKFIS